MCLIHLIAIFNFSFSRFPPVDTNLVLREFEKCGIILRHVPGPRDANWMNILYQVISQSVESYIMSSPVEFPEIVFVQK